jgi:outer membrane protein assembly factor BamB
MGRFFSAAAVVLAMSGTISAANWPSFRGPSGDGISLEKKLPLKWSATV